MGHRAGQLHRATYCSTCGCTRSGATVLDSQRAARVIAIIQGFAAQRAATCMRQAPPPSFVFTEASRRPAAQLRLHGIWPAGQLPTAGLDSRPAGLGYQLRMARKPAGRLRSVPHHPRRGALSAILIAHCPALLAPRPRAMTTASAGGGARPQPCETCRLPQAAAQGRIAGIARALPRRARLPPRRTCRFCPHARCAPGGTDDAHHVACVSSTALAPHARCPPGGIASQPCPRRPPRPTPRSIRARRAAAPHRLHEQWAATARDWARGDAGRLPARLAWAAATDAAARHRRGGGGGRGGDTFVALEEGAVDKHLPTPLLLNGSRTSAVDKHLPTPVSHVTRAQAQYTPRS